MLRAVNKEKFYIKPVINKTPINHYDIMNPIFLNHNNLNIITTTTALIY